MIIVHSFKSLTGIYVIIISSGVSFDSNSRLRAKICNEALVWLLIDCEFTDKIYCTEIAKCYLFMVRIHWNILIIIYNYRK